VTVSKHNPWLQEFPDPITRVSGIIMLQYLMQMLKNTNSNEIVANGGLNGSYATITTADGFKLEMCQLLFNQVKRLNYWFYLMSSSLERRNDGGGLNAYSLYKGFDNQFADGGNMSLCSRSENVNERHHQRNLLEIFNTKDAHVWNEQPMVSLDHKEVEATKVDLWDSFDRSTGHHFNLR
jgi:molybdopterin-containing oxidoreductase family iron-sulfur binding subunit